MSSVFPNQFTYTVPPLAIHNVAPYLVTLPSKWRTSSKHISCICSCPRHSLHNISDKLSSGTYDKLPKRTYEWKWIWLAQRRFISKIKSLSGPYNGSVNRPDRFMLLFLYFYSTPNNGSAIYPFTHKEHQKHWETDNVKDQTNFHFMT